jgi:catechol 2,3-dioxygenase-like lactoylglutathione lyase family enzyme
MAAHWTHLATTVSDVEKSVEFYKKFCSLTIVRDRRLEGGSTVWLGPATREGELPTFVLVLMKGEVANKLDHLGFLCDSKQEVDDIAREGERLGIVEYPPTDSGGSVGYWVMLRDPDGHHVEFAFGQPLLGLR